MVDQDAVFALGDDEAFGIVQTVDQIKPLFMTENHNGSCKSVCKGACVRYNRDADNTVIHRVSISRVYDVRKTFLIDFEIISIVAARCKTFVL